MQSFREYAEQNGVTYEAIRKQCKRYEEELRGHVFIKNRTSYLDEYAIEFLDGKRKENPIIAYNMDKDEELSMLQDQVKQLQQSTLNLSLKLNEVQEKLINEKNISQQLLSDKIQLLQSGSSEEVNRLQAENAVLKEEKNRDLENLNEAQEEANQAKLEQHKAETDLDRIRMENEALQAQNDELRKRIESIGEMGWFEFRKWKKSIDQEG